MSEENNDLNKDNEPENNMDNEELGSAAKKALGKRATRGAGAKKALSQPWAKILIIGLIIGLIVPGMRYLSFGSRFQLAESQHPIGYYNIYIVNVYDVDNLTGKLVLSNTTDIIEEYDLNNITNTTTYYAPQQLYLSLVSERFQAVSIAVECSDDKLDPKVNKIYLYPKATNDMLDEINVSIFEIPENYTSDDNLTINYYTLIDMNGSYCYNVTENQTYGLKVHLVYHANEKDKEPFIFGRFVIYPDPVLKKYFPLDYQINVTNYNAHYFLMNTTMQNTLFTYANNPDVSYFSLNHQNFTSFMLPAVAIIEDNESTDVGHDIIDVIVYFSPAYNSSVGISITDGFYDSCFDENYMYYKLGGFKIE